MKKPFIQSLILGGILVMTVLNTIGCATEKGTYQDPNVYSKALYGDVVRRSFDYEGPGRNPVIVIHGLLGAKLTDTLDSQNIWGSFSLTELLSGRKFRRLAHPMEFGIPLHALKSSVRPTGILARSEIRVMGMEFDFDGYDILIDTLERGGYVPDTKPLPENKKFYSQFVFYYDWRRDISENAVRLHEFIQERRKYLQKEYAAHYGLKNFNVKFDIIAHSMGGLLARYYLRYGGTRLPDREEETPKVTWEGSRSVDKLVIVATPNAGYVDTLLELVGGLRIAPGAPPYPKALIGTFVSYYQMLPNPEGKNILYENGSPVDYLQPEVWTRFGWGLADPAQDEWLRLFLPEIQTAEGRRRVALDHLSKCLMRARQFKKAMQTAQTPPENVAVYLIAGDALPTNHTVAVDPKTGAVRIAKRDAGDGKITASSARLDLRDGGRWFPFMVSPIDWTGVYYLQGGHMGIMNSDIFNTNLYYILLCWPTDYQRRNTHIYLKLLEKTEKLQSE